MNKIYNVILAINLALFPLIINGQEVDETVNRNYSTIGNVVRNLKINKIINDKVKSAQLSDYKDQLLILDFGTTGCGPCMAALPKLDSLQKVFKDQIKILPVTPEPEKSVRDFYKNNLYAKRTSLPSVVEDSILQATFKHYDIPFEVWIYKGNIIALTDESYVEADYIQKVLNGETNNWPVINDVELYDPKQGSLVNFEKNSKPKLYSAIIPFSKIYHSFETFSSVIDSTSHTRKNYAFNIGIKELYRGLWYRLGVAKFCNPNDVIYNVRDKIKYRYDKKKYRHHREWREANMICYESVITDYGLSDKENYKLMMSDLNKLLGLEIYWEKRKEEVYVIKQVSKQNVKINTKSIKTGISLQELVFMFNQYEERQKLINEVNKIESQIKLPIDPRTLTDYESLKTKLAPYGFEVYKELREVDNLVINENGFRKVK